MSTITLTALASALASHVDTLALAGITYDGHLTIEEGSASNGRAYRLYRTGYPVPAESGGYRPGTGLASPPIGSDFLGWTKREAYETLTTRTRIIGETFYALESRIL